MNSSPRPLRRLARSSTGLRLCALLGFLLSGCPRPAAPPQPNPKPPKADPVKTVLKSEAAAAIMTPESLGRLTAPIAKA